MILLALGIRSLRLDRSWLPVLVQLHTGDSNSMNASKVYENLERY